MRADFYHADCNQDDTLTWGEYHDFRFRGKRYDSPAVPTVQQWLALDPEFDKLAGLKSLALSERADSFSIAAPSVTRPVSDAHKTPSRSNWK
ncbi:hypothetical protein ACL7TT_06460 [Microbulbifer sp. 2304DJ12-6]|uniref:hypothetical protein n=1 Tax=Microbulbifer sp. 2304DJ12-6 TaxID=3233340 RepID=UPI0039B0FEFB